MKYPQVQRAALGLMVSLAALLATTSAWAAPLTDGASAPAVARAAQTQASSLSSPAKQVLAWHRVGSPGTPRDAILG